MLYDACMFVFSWWINTRHLFSYVQQDRLRLPLLIPAHSMAAITHPLRHPSTPHLSHPRIPLLRHPRIPQQHHIPHLLRPATPPQLPALQAPLQQDTNHHHPHSMVVVLDTTTSSFKLHPLSYSCLGEMLWAHVHSHLHLPNKMKQTATLTCSLFLEHRSISNNCPVRIYAAVVCLVVPVCVCICFPKTSCLRSYRLKISR